MRRLGILALVAMASASFYTVDAAKKKVAPKPETPVVVPVDLKTSSDSMSYIAGMSATMGLVDYLLQQKVDTACMTDFVRGFKETVAKNTANPKVKAYLMGVSIAQQLNDRMLPGVSKEFKDTPDSITANLFYKGFVDGLLQDTTFFKAVEAESMFRAKAEAAKAARDEKLYGENRKAGEAFLAENAKKDGVITLPSGLQYKVLTKGTGKVPQMSDKVKVNYEGRLLDGTVFDSSYKRNEPAEFTPTQVIKGWTEALTMMPVGSKWQLYIPCQLAYGDRDTGTIKPYSMLIFDVELLDIVKK